MKQIIVISFALLILGCQTTEKDFQSKAAPEVPPPQSTNYILMAHYAFDRKDYEGPITLANQEIEHGGEIFNALYLIFDANIARKEFYLAIDSAKKMIQISPKDIVGYQLSADIYFLIDDYANAVVYYQLLLNNFPDHWWYLSKLADSYFNSHDLEAAKIHYLELLRYEQKINFYDIDFDAAKTKITMIQALQTGQK